jgi:hypothetical protein
LTNPKSEFKIFTVLQTKINDSVNDCLIEMEPTAFDLNFNANIIEYPEE